MEYKVVPSDRFNDIIVHLRKTFFCDEPLNKSVKLCKSGEGHLELEQQSLASLQDGLSIMAVTADDQVYIFFI